MNKAMKLGELESRVCDSSFNLGTAGRNGVFVSVSFAAGNTDQQLICEEVQITLSCKIEKKDNV